MFLQKDSLYGGEAYKAIQPGVKIINFLLLEIDVSLLSQAVVL